MYLSISCTSVPAIPYCSTGGTVDITVHEVAASGGLRELYKANGGNWGGTYIDQAFR